jgi:uncharacterized protein YbjT (DUF2867 family)
MNIGVSGASGHLGRAVVSELLQRPGGHEVVAITRTPETISGPAQGRFGDYNRPESLAEAYAGLDRLLIIPTVATGAERLSGAERAGLIAEITGRPLAFRVITEEQLRAGLTQAGLPPGAVNNVISIQASFAAGAFDIVTGDVERLGGRPAKPLRDVLAGALKSPSA